MAKLNIRDLEINFRCVGEGEDLVLIHGLAANHAFWNLKVLLPLARTYRVTVYDLRGHGYSGMPPTGYTSADLAEDLHHLLNHLNIERTHLAGHSMGGVIALQYAALHPERVRRLIVADTRIRAFQPTQYPRDWPNWPKAKKRLEEVGLSIPEDIVESGLWLLEKLATPEWRRARYKLEGSPLFIPFSRWGGGNHSADRWLELLTTTTARQELLDSAGLTAERISQIHIPSLIMYGELSTTLPSFWGLRSRLPDNRAVIIPGAGHFFPASQPELFVDKVSQFLEQKKTERHRERKPA